MLEEREESAPVIIKNAVRKEKEKGAGTTGASDNRRMADLS